MSYVTPEFLIRTFQSLTGNTDEMQTISLFIRTNKADHALINSIFIQELKSSNAQHKLLLFYLANEVIQTTKKTDEDGMNLILGIKKMIPPILITTLENIRDMNLAKRYNDLVRVWIERKIFNEEDFGIQVEKKINVNTNLDKKSVLNTNNGEDFGKVTSTREEIIGRINKYYESKNELIKYLKEYIMKLENE